MIIDKLPVQFWNFKYSNIELSYKSKLIEGVELLHKQITKFEYDIFICFSTKDHEIAIPVWEILRGYGLKVFVSDEDLQNTVGFNFLDKIDYALSNSQHLVLLASKNAFGSVYVRDEYQAFYSDCHVKNPNNRLLIVYKLGDFPIQQLPRILRTKQIATNPEQIVSTLVQENLLKTEELNIKSIELGHRNEERKIKEQAEFEPEQEEKRKANEQTEFKQKNEYVDYYSIRNKIGKWGYIDHFGNVKIDLIYDGAFNFQGDYAMVVQNFEYGLIDRNGNFQILPQYDYMRYNETTQKIVVKKDKYGLIDLNNNVLIDFIYDIFYYSNGLFWAMKNNCYGFIDETGKTVIDFIYPDAKAFKEGYAFVMNKSGFWGVIDKKGQLIINYKYKKGSYFNEGLSNVKFKDKVGFINIEDKIIVDFKFEDAKNFRNGFAAVKMRGKWGFINSQGITLTDYQFDDVLHFNENKAAVKKNDKWGFINTNGDLIIDFQFDNTHGFNNGFGYVFLDNKEFYIDETGEKKLSLS